MKAFGLTGNMGCGKSTVAKLLVIQGNVVVFDCDKIAKEIISSDAVRQDVIGIAGNEIFRDDGKIDWKKLAKVIFSDKRKKRRFENLIHPLVRETIARGAEDLEDNMIGIVESAIIFENSWQSAFDGVIVATCGDEEQMRRIRTRPIDEEDIHRRLHAQLPQWEKEHRANFVISTECTPDELATRTNNLYLQLKQFNGKE